jgi:glucose-fructose oxidoreductase
MQVARGNVRTESAFGAGTLYDIGIYCINAARHIFADEPTEGFCLSATGNDPRFRKVEEMASAILRFPRERIASFTTSFGAAETADFEVMGTKGRLRACQAYDYSMPVILELTVDGRTQRKLYPLRDQFAPELIYFSDCVLHDREPEPSGIEGLRDIHIIRSLYQSAASHSTVKLAQIKRKRYPSLKQQIYRPRVTKPKLVHVTAPTA